MLQISATHIQSSEFMSIRLAILDDVSDGPIHAWFYLLVFGLNRCGDIIDHQVSAYSWFG